MAPIHNIQRYLPRFMKLSSDPCDSMFKAGFYLILGGDILTSLSLTAQLIYFDEELSDALLIIQLNLDAAFDIY